MKANIMFDQKEYVKKHRRNNPEMYRIAQSNYRKRTYKTDLHRERQRRYKKRLKEKVFAAYGNKCICCGESEPLFLEIDHINNDGAEHRRKIPINTIYRWLKKNNYPDNYQILCCNCNRGKWLNGGICPHKNRRADEA